MQRTITVKGIGSASAKVDYVVINLKLESINMNYHMALGKAESLLEQIRTSLYPIGFDKNDIKTTNFEIESRYVYKKKSGTEDSYRSFAGFACKHELKISFDFTTEKLSQVINVLADCKAKPDLDINFTVKDYTAIKEELLQSAIENAKSTAQTLCKASDVKLGNIIKIDYNWTEIEIYSGSRLEGDYLLQAPSLDIELDDVNARDTVSIVWEIE